jgi:hypothetical protein
MAPFQSYVSNLYRVRSAELIGHHTLLIRHSRARASLIVNPLTRRPYPDSNDDAQILQSSAPSMASKPSMRRDFPANSA